MTQKRTFQRRPEAEALLRATDSERLRFIRQDRWIGYPVAQDALDALERLHDYPSVRRPPNQLIVGETNNGKTTLVDRFVELHPEIDEPGSQGVCMPVLKLDAPQSAAEDRLYNHILEQLGEPFSLRAPPDGKFFQICHLLKDMGVRVLILDEINNSTAGTDKQRMQMFNAIREIGNRIRRPTVLTGTFDALTAMRDMRQMQNRFPPLVLPTWQLDSAFLQLLASFESILPLRRRSYLASERLAPLLLVMSGGTIGELHFLLVKAAEAAIRNGSDRITRILLLELPWLPPDLRDAHASAAEHGQAAPFKYRDRLNALGHTTLTEDDPDGDAEPQNEQEDRATGA
ncbi:TniB family NTP-binding protein [Deinococcus radiomollis]|uniref:TniB family NTP-binding protein n=1 Tax=Deinococcus radiomollis TaxID=468916 RepID=UPI0038921EFC